MGDRTQPSRNIEAVHRLSPVQEGILYHTLLADDPGMYVQQYSCQLTGEVDSDLFRAAWDRVISEYAALRTLIAWRGRESPLRVVRSRVDPDWYLEDLSGLEAESQAGAVVEHAEQERNTGFELDQAPLMRFSLLRLDERRHRFVWTHHHIILDGWSINLVLERVFEIYGHLVADLDPPELQEVSYEGFVQEIASRDRSHANDFWARYLKGFDESNSLNVSGRAPDSPFATRQSETSKVLSAIETEEVEAAAKRLGMTLDTFLKTAWAMVISRYSGDSDVVFGSVVSGRLPDLDGAMSMVGMTINTIPHRINVSPDMTLRDLIETAASDRLQVIDHEWMPLAEIQVHSGVAAGSPLFETVLVLENLSPMSLPDDFAISVDDVSYPQRSNFSLALLVNPGVGLELVLLHDPSRFTPVQAEALLDHFVRALQSLTGNPDSIVRDVQLLSPEELELVSRHPKPLLSDPEPVMLRFIRSAERVPDDVAVATGAVALTYAELADRARALADELAVRGAEPGTRVAISIDRSAAQIVAIVGILLARCAYVPLDPSMPEARMREILDHSRCRYVLTTNCDEPSDAVDHICLNADGILRHPMGSSGPRLDLASPDLTDTAYVIHTSGSTGQPKGVPISQKSLAISTDARLDYYRDQVSAFLLISPYYFDSSIAGIFWTLCSGGKLVLPTPGSEQDVVALAELIKNENVTHTLMLPSILRILMSSASPDALASLQTVIAAGEPLPPALVQARRDSDFRWSLYNEYGPTEATVWSTVLDTDDLESNLPERIPIGSPIPPVGHHVLDRGLQPVPPGALGELYLSGETLTSGYIANGQDPGESFVETRIAASETVRLYRTGDLARVDAGGRFDVVGRTDRQVKIRGMRVEPGEVESTLMLHPEVSSAVVVARSRGADSRLEAFVTSSGSVSGGEAMSFLQERLPVHLVPASITVVDSIPSTRSGKIDFQALVAIPDDPDRQGPDETEWSEAQRLVVGIARDLIGDPGIDVGDNFFDAGGHSLLSMHLIARIYKETGARVPPNAVLFNSLGYLAEKVGGESDAAPARPRQSGSVQPAFIEGSSGPLFTVTHSPTQAALRATLIVPPYGWEYFKTHSALRRLATSLTEEGHAVARFDLYGTGDSGGDSGDANIAQWLDDIDRAAEHLIGQTSAGRVTVVGLRLGASLAALWARQREATISNLVMWDPIMRGEDHLDQLQSMNSRFMATKRSRRTRQEGSDELLGSEYPASLRKEIAALDLAEIDLSGMRSTGLLSAPQPGVAATLERAGASVEIVPDAGGWTDLRTFMWALLPTAIPRRIVELFRDDDA